ncbi:MAG: ABC transporter permease [Verrucomicrobiota bacterium]|nr:ABC transporter permease [Verrucomicrobiota bacterium]
MELIISDIKHGLRLLAKNPGYSILAVLALALGIGGVTTQFSLINAAILKGLPYPEQDRLVSVRQLNPHAAEENQNNNLSVHSYMDVRKQATSFEDIGAGFDGTINLSYEGQAYRLNGGRVTWNFTKILGVQPIIGQAMTEADDQPGKPPVILLGYHTWKNQFDGDVAVIGKPARVNGMLGTIIGVMPEGFAYPDRNELWIPLASQLNWLQLKRGEGFDLNCYGRLKPGVTYEQATAELSIIANQLAQEYPETNKGYTAGEVRPLIREQTPDWVRDRLYFMLAAVVFVMLIACANVANLQLARIAARSRELAIRSALGASRSRLVVQILTESVVMAGVGALLGMGIAHFGIEAIKARAEALFLPQWWDFSIDWRILGIVTGLTLLCGILSGLMPALKSSKTDINEILKDNTRTGSSVHMGKLTKIMVVAQIAFSCLVLVGSGLMIRSLQNQSASDFGYDLNSYCVARAGLFQADYPKGEDRYKFFRNVTDSLKQDPRVAEAATSARIRFWGANGTRLEIEGAKPFEKDTDYPFSWGEVVSYEYFNLNSIKLLSGRDFMASDITQKNPVTIVTEKFARKHWPNEDPIGKRFKRRVQQSGNAPGAVAPDWVTVIGVVKDMKISPLWQNNDPGEGTAFFEPLTPDNAPMFMTIAAKPRGGPILAMGEVLREHVRKYDPNLPLYWVTTPAVLLDEDLAQSRFLASSFGIFGTVAVFLAAIGIYGVMSFSVNQRKQEFGIRLALGARSRQIAELIFRQGAIQAGIGLVVGIGTTLTLALLMSRFIAQLLFDVKPTDPATYILVVMALTGVAFLACLRPAIKASRTHPMQALRPD